MRDITTTEVKDPVQLARYLRDMAHLQQEMYVRDQQRTAEVPLLPYTPPPEKLPDQVLADLQLTQVPRVHNYTGTASPTASDNLAHGYVVGSEWIVGTTEIWKCVYSDNTTATWIQIYP